MTSSSARGSDAALLHKALAFHQAGRISEAEQIYDKLLKRNPAHGDALNLKGIVASNHGRHDAAIRLFDQAIASLPSFADVHFNKGNSLAALGRKDEALLAYHRAISLKPAYADARLNAGRILHESGQRDAAIAAFRDMARVAPNDARARYNLGVCLTEALDAIAPADQAPVAAEALAALHRADTLDPGNSHVHFALSNLFSQRGDYERAIEHIGVSLKLDPNRADAWNNLANHWEAVGAAEKALDAFEHALTLNPANLGAIVNRGLTQLSLGKFAAGWAGYARRLDDVRFPSLRLKWPWPKWQGEDLKGKSILIWGDQGIGDEVLHGTMIQELTEQAARCFVLCAPRLVPLYQRSFARAEVAANTWEMWSVLNTELFDYHTSILDVGPWRRTSFGAFPNRGAVLRADAERSAALRHRYFAARPGSRLVGLSWRSINPGFGHQKSIALQEFRPLLERSEFTFVNMQYGDTTLERNELKDAGISNLLHDPDIDGLADLDALAAQIGALDALVTVSNSTAHLAGALGVPTFLSVPRNRKHLWYWLHDGEYSPWYRSIFIHRGTTAQFAEEAKAALLDLPDARH